MINEIIGMRTVNSEIFAWFLFYETSHTRNFMKIKFSQNGEITLPLIDIDKTLSDREFKLRKYVLVLFAKIKFSRKFPYSIFKTK